MEVKEGVNDSGVSGSMAGAPGAVLTPAPPVNGAPGAVLTPAPPVNGAPGVVLTLAPPVSVAVVGTEVKKKRGRPRKYAPDGSVTTALSPMPISASIPLTGNYSAWKHTASRPMESFKKKHKLDFGNPGVQVAHCFSASFMPHVITVNVGEDVTMKIMSLAQQESRVVCVLSANGSISNVTLRHPNSSGGTLTYEGPFEILSLNGSFMPSSNNNGVAKSTSGGLSVSLACADGRVLGGGLAGMLLAGGAVQVVVGSFLGGNQMEEKPKKQRYEHTLSFTTTPIPAKPVSAVRSEEAYGAPKTHSDSPAAFFHGNNLTVMDFEQGSKISAPENNISFTGSESTDPSPSRCEVSC